PVRDVRLAEPGRQALVGLSAGPADPPRRALGARRLSADADRLLPGLSDHCDRPDLVGILVPLDGACLLAERTTVVPRRPVDVQRSRRAALLACSGSGWFPRQPGRRQSRPPGPLFLGGGRRVGGGLCATRPFL